LGTSKVYADAPGLKVKLFKVTGADTDID